MNAVIVATMIFWGLIGNHISLVVAFVIALMFMRMISGI